MAGSGSVNELSTFDTLSSKSNISLNSRNSFDCTDSVDSNSNFSFNESCDSISSSNSNTGPNSTNNSKFLAKDAGSQQEDPQFTANTLYFKRISSALFFGMASLMITVVNKTVLTTYHFPSFLFLSMGQLSASILVLGFGKMFKFITFPALDRRTFMTIFPLPIFFVGNMMSGLGGTQALSLPMFAALRRFAILMTMFLEFKVLGVNHSVPIQFSVFAMVGGAIMAAYYDFAFNINGYVYVMISNALTALNGVYVKKKLQSTQIGKYGLIFYNSLFMFIPALIITYLTGDLAQSLSSDSWTNPYFLVQFILSCSMGFVLIYSNILCTQYNSALTTDIVGCLKNICVTYLGMFIGGDYIFSWLNCFGLNISVLASLLYTYVTFRPKQVAGSDKKPLLPNGTKGKIQANI